MKRVINGKVYNTETATRICQLPCHVSGRDFSYHHTWLYRSPKGTFFLAGEGGPLSMWAQPWERNGHRGGEGIRVLDRDEALEYAESAELSQEDMTAAGFEIAEG